MSSSVLGAGIGCFSMLCDLCNETLEKTFSSGKICEIPSGYHQQSEDQQEVNELKTHGD